MNKVLITPTIIPPTSYYSHAQEVPAGSRTLFISGQIPVTADGVCPPDFESQARQCWRNLAAVLAAADMDMGDVVRVQAFVTRVSDLEAYRAIRNEIVGDLRPAHTLLVVARLGKPEWHVEIEAIAAKAP